MMDEDDVFRPSVFFLASDHITAQSYAVAHAPRTSALRTLVFSKKYNKAPGAIGAANLCMYGGMAGMGKLWVPVADMVEVARAIVEDYSSGVLWALTENKSLGQAIRFFMDFDIKFANAGEVALADGTWVHVQRIVTTTIRKFFMPATDISCVVAASGVHSIKAMPADGIYARAGVHLYFPQVWVDVMQARTLALNIIVALQRETPKIKLGCLDWSKIVDDGVYSEGRGLRMIGQVKSKSCEPCGGKRAPPGVSAHARCVSCGGCGSLIDTTASMYLPAALADGEGRLACIDTPRTASMTVDWFLTCSLRGVRPDMPYTTNWHVPSGSVEPPPPKAPGAKPQHAKGVLLSLDDPKTVQLQKALQSIVLPGIGSPYASVMIRVVSENEKNFVIDVHGNGARFCNNKGSEHTTQLVYFLVDKKTGDVQQRCYSRHVHNNKSCSTFRARLGTPPVRALIPTEDAVANTFAHFILPSNPSPDACIAAIQTLRFRFNFSMAYDGPLASLPPLKTIVPNVRVFAHMQRAVYAKKRAAERIEM